jgi:hypothetical protein
MQCIHILNTVHSWEENARNNTLVGGLHRHACACVTHLHHEGDPAADRASDELQHFGETDGLDRVAVYFQHNLRVRRASSHACLFRMDTRASDRALAQQRDNTEQQTLQARLMSHVSCRMPHAHARCIHYTSKVTWPIRSSPESAAGPPSTRSTTVTWPPRRCTSTPMPASKTHQKSSLPCMQSSSLRPSKPTALFKAGLHAVKWCMHAAVYTVCALQQAQ